MIYDLAVLATIEILETILCWSWAGPYYRYGIPVFSRTVPFYANTSSYAISDLLSKELSRSWGRSQVFHPISDYEVAFREKAFEFRVAFNYTPIMHGFITILPLERTITVKGFLDWFLIAFIIFVMPFVVDANSSFFKLTFGAGFCLTISSIYFIQARAYKRIVRVLRDKGQSLSP
jgi:hypothetical protein